MQYRTVPNTDLSLSVVGFGLWTVTTSWWGVDGDATGLDLLRKAYDRGVTFFDTADTYGDGKGESLLADALGDVRDKIVIGTKFGYDFYNNADRQGQRERPQDFSPKFVARDSAQVATRISNARSPLTTRDVAPVPLLGIPGWCADNEDGRYYDNAAYFRPRRTTSRDRR